MEIQNQYPSLQHSASSPPSQLPFPLQWNPLAESFPWKNLNLGETSLPVRCGSLRVGKRGDGHEYLLRRIYSIRTGPVGWRIWGMLLVFLWWERWMASEFPLLMLMMPCCRLSLLSFWFGRQDREKNLEADYIWYWMKAARWGALCPVNFLLLLKFWHRWCEKQIVWEKGKGKILWKCGGTYLG